MVVWSADARADLSEIWDYYASIAGPNTADSVVQKINDACRVLDDHPLAGRSRSEIRPGLRSVVARPHVVFYRVQRDIAEIVRVLDGPARSG